MANVVRIGYWVPEKKKKKMQLSKLEQLCRQCQAEAIFLDLEKPLDSQGPFDVILHKLSDEITVAAECGNKIATRRLNNFLSYVSSHPEVPIVDPLERTLRLRDRCVMFDLLSKACQSLTDCKDGIKVFVPSFVELDGSSSGSEWMKLIKESHVQFPIVCKPSDAGVPETAHNMSLVFTPEGLKDVAPPCVAQSFINHDGMLYKLFVFGEKHFLTSRPSIKNITPGNFSTEHFTTNDVSKPDSKSHLIHAPSKATSRDSGLSRVNCDVMENIAVEVRKTLGIDLMGIDVIISCDTGFYAIIDVNPFPGFNGIPEIHDKLLDYLLSRALQYRSSKHSKE